MNNFEKKLCKSIVKIGKDYEKYSGNWLFHAPEHFLQNGLFLELGRASWWVHLEASRKKISRESGLYPRGRPPTKRNRHDLVVWQKSADTLRAVIEIKKTWGMTESIRKDAEKIKRAVRSQHKAKSGYLIILREFRGNADGSELFDDWAKKLGLCCLFSKIINKEEQENGWTEAFCLLRVPT